MVVTLAGMSDAGQPGAAGERAPPMLVTLAGMVTLVSPVQPENALVADGGDAGGDGDAGQPGAAGEREGPMQVTLAGMA